MTLDLITFTYRLDKQTVLRVTAEVAWYDPDPIFSGKDPEVVARITHIAYRKTDDVRFTALPDWAEPKLSLYRTLEDEAIRQYQETPHV